MLVSLKKALLIQILFWGPWIAAQSIYLESPRPGAPLENPQQFLVEFSGPTPSRVEFYLNGNLRVARRQPPFRFEITWNTRFENRVEVIAYYQDETPVRLARRFREIRTDLETSVEAFQCFPFMEAHPDKVELFSGKTLVKPQLFEPANKFILQLVIALDVSGSMRHALPDLSAPMREFLSFCTRQGYQLRFFTFDTKAMLFETDLIPENIERFYRAEENSIIWDALATAASLFDVGPRRIILLISDGVDDGSDHDEATVKRYLYETGAVLIWLNPGNLPNRDLARLAGFSGGFSLFSENNDPWPLLTNRLDHQYHLLAPNVGFPISLTVSPGHVWYPSWRR